MFYVLTVELVDGKDMRAGKLHGSLKIPYTYGVIQE